MERRTFIKLLAVSSTGTASFLYNCITTKKNQPNVLLILSDDQGWGDVQSHQNPDIDTPVLDKIAREGARFNRFYVSPVCAPTRASLLTGRYHLRTGTIWVTHGKETMRNEEKTIAEILSNNGYATGCFGKWHNGAYYPHDPNGQGFDEFLGFCAGHWNNYFNTTLQHNHKQVQKKGFITDVLTDAAVEFININKHQPFFCYVPYNVPHSPFQVPENLFKKYKDKGFNEANACVYAMVENMDTNIGRLLETIQQKGLTDNTIVIFITDNGPNTDRFNGNMKGRKGSVHEGGVRVPCFIKWPGKICKGVEIDTIAAHIDILPTVLELCNITIPENIKIDGISLAPLIKQTDLKWPDRTLYTHHTQRGIVKHAPGAARTQQYRLIVNQKDYELYDMLADPSESKDIIKEKPNDAQRLITQYHQWYTDVTRNIIDRPDSIPVGYDEAKAVNLLAPEAYLKGGLRYKGAMGWANDWITNWIDIKASVSWNIHIVDNANYSITLLYACAQSDIGSVIKVSVANKQLVNTITKAHDPEPLPSPDRVKRKEVYEKVWGEFEMGILQLSKGPQKLEVKAESIPGNTAMELKAVRINKI